MTYIRGGEDGDGMRRRRDDRASILIYMQFPSSVIIRFWKKQNGNCSMEIPERIKNLDGEK
jgi:hypothetical protein